MAADPSLLFLLVIFVVNFCGAILGAAIGVYVKKRAENLATKADLAELTRIAGEVNHHFQELLAMGSHEHQMRMAAIDRRLEAYQKAYSLWRSLLSASNNSERCRKAVTAAEEWFIDNCLYLDAPSRHAFAEAYLAAYLRIGLLADRQASHLDEAKRSAQQALVDNMKTVLAAGDVIVRGAGLPPLKVETGRES